MSNTDNPKDRFKKDNNKYKQEAEFLQEIRQQQVSGAHFYMKFSGFRGAVEKKFVVYDSRSLFIFDHSALLKGLDQLYIGILNYVTRLFCIFSHRTCISHQCKLMYFNQDAYFLAEIRIHLCTFYP